MGTTVSLAPVMTTTPNQDATPTRISKAASEFEAILLRSLLEPIEKSFSAISGDIQAAGQDDYRYMSAQALASALASCGGLGFSQLITKQLTRASAVERG
jgi:Rod binding domain-containing protein